MMCNMHCDDDDDDAEDPAALQVLSALWRGFFELFVLILFIFLSRTKKLLKGGFNCTSDKCLCCSVFAVFHNEVVVCSSMR